MIVLGLTGSIAMGKTETAKMFAARGIPVFDSDGAVHKLYARGGEAVATLSGIVPSVISEGAVERGLLAAEVQRDPALLKKIEAIVHPLVKARQFAFLSGCRAEGAAIAVLDIPLLFETGRDKDVDRIAVVSTSPEIQRARALKRPGMTEEKLQFILSKQMPDAQKRSRAYYVIDTSLDFETTARQVDQIIAELKSIGRS